MFIGQSEYQPVGDRGKRGRGLGSLFYFINIAHMLIPKEGSIGTEGAGGHSKMGSLGSRPHGNNVIKYFIIV